MEILGELKAVESPCDLDTSKYYALKINDHIEAKELGRFVGLCEHGASFVIMDTLVRQDRALHNVIIRKRAIPAVVFELDKENHE